MNFKRTALALLLSVAFVGFVADPVLAAPTTPTNQFINELNEKLLYIAVPITVLVEGILLYAVLKFRNNENPTPTEENRRLEVTWTVATALVLLFVGVASYGVMAEITTPPDAQADGDEVRVDVTAAKWSWSFEYPEQNAQSSGTMVIPVDQRIHLNITSTDWIHSFHVPEMGLKQDAMPGDSIPLEFTATETGEYTLYCAEYCGQGHSQMLGTVEVVSQEEYQTFLEENGSGGSSDGSDNSSSSE